MPNKPASPLYIHACGSHSALGWTHEMIHQHLQQGKTPYMQVNDSWLNDGSETVVGTASGPRPDIDSAFTHQDTHNNRLALLALLQIESTIKQTIEQYGSDRVAILIGTSTSGIADGREMKSQYIMSNNFAFGGINTSLIFKRLDL